MASSILTGDKVDVRLERRSDLLDLENQMHGTGMEGAEPDVRMPDEDEPLSPNDDWFEEFGFEVPLPVRKGT